METAVAVSGTTLTASSGATVSEMLVQAAEANAVVVEKAARARRIGIFLISNNIPYCR